MTGRLFLATGSAREKGQDDRGRGAVAGEGASQEDAEALPAAAASAGTARPAPSSAPSDGTADPPSPAATPPPADEDPESPVAPTAPLRTASGRALARVRVKARAVGRLSLASGRRARARREVLAGCRCRPLYSVRVLFAGQTVRVASIPGHGKQITVVVGVMRLETMLNQQSSNQQAYYHLMMETSPSK